MSVEAFMRNTFGTREDGTIEDWSLLVDAGTVGGR